MRWLLHVLMSLLLFVLVKFGIGNYYEQYEAIPPSTINGSLMGGHPADIIYPIASVGLSHIYVVMYQWLPQVAWYDYFMALYFIMAGAAVFSAVHSALQARLRLRYIVAINAIIYVLFFAEHIIHWNFTRTSLIVCSAAFVWLVMAWLMRPANERPLKRLLLPMLLFSIGMLVRPESGELVFILSAFAIVVVFGMARQSLLAIGSLLIPVVIIAGTIYLHRHFSSEFYLRLQPVTEYQIALGNVRGLDEMKTTSDSMKYRMVHEGIVCDPGPLSYDFIEKLTKDKALITYRPDLLMRATEIMHSMALSYHHYILLNVLLLLAGLWYLRMRPLALVRCLSLHFFLWGLMFFTSYLMVMEKRIIGPMMFFYTAGNFIFLLREGFFTSGFQRGWRFAFIIVIFLLGKVQLDFLFNQAEDYEKKIALSHARYRALQKIAADKMLMPDAQALMMVFFDNFRPFHNADFSAFQNFFLTDFEAVSITPAYRAYLGQLCHCNSTDLAQFFDYLYSHQQEVMFAGGKERWPLYLEYLKIVRGKNYQLKPAAIIANRTDSLYLSTFQ